MPAIPTKAERLAGGLIGLLVGDALGVPYEFHRASDIPPAARIEFAPPPGFRRAHGHVPPGTWSDDGAQALVLLNSLLECGQFDAEHFAAGLIDWHDNGFMAVDGRVFDVGIQTLTALNALKRGAAARDAGGSGERDNGNGSLMRALPLALWHRGSDSDLIRDSFAQSSVTHGHIRSQLCCALYCFWARRILEGADDPWHAALETLRRTFPEGSAQRSEIETRILAPDCSRVVQGSGYVVDSLRAALWANERSSYEEVVKAAIALGDDTDTNACITGGIAGLRLGIDAIPARWREALRGKEIYEPLLERLIAQIGSA